MKIRNNRPNALHFIFNEDFILSAIWGAGSYTVNHDVINFTEFMSSPNIEVHFLSCPQEFRRKLMRKYKWNGDDPIGYLPVDEFIEILNYCRKLFTNNENNRNL
jgi:hypothetical protein